MVIDLARSPNENAEKARKLYEGGMKLVEIASQLIVKDLKEVGGDRNE